MRYLFRDRIAHWFLVCLLLVFVATSFYAPSASAHGEKSQAAFMRMRTIQWFDLTWSKESVNVNEEMEIKGKFHVFEGWPETVPEPNVAFLNIGIPGQVFIRKESYIGGQLVPRSVRLEIGKTYEFKVVLRARRPGDWHIHTMMNVEGCGPIIGPGKWITINGRFKDFKNPVTTLTGETVDLETYQEGNIAFWHVLWYVFGIAWIVYWVRRPVFLPRLLLADAGRADELVSSTDRKVGMGFVVATIVIVVASVSATNDKYPITIPLQAGTMRGMVPIEEKPTVAVKVEDASYQVPIRAMRMKLTITNNGNAAVRLGEFYTASVRFLDSSVYKDTTGYPEDLLAEDGLQITDNSPLAPGETRTVEVTASDAAWEVYRLSDIIYDPDSRAAGLLFFYHTRSDRRIVPVDAPLIPSFTPVTPTPAAVAGRCTNYKIVRVFFATDRNRTQNTTCNEMFGVDHSTTLSYGICDVSIPDCHKKGELESPPMWKQEFREDPAEYVVLLNGIPLFKDEFFINVAADMLKSGSASALLFVHGYSVSFLDAARRTAQISYDLGFKGAPVFYSWPSHGKLLKYPDDARNIELAESNLKGFLEDFFARSKAQSVYLIAHSMGSRALTHAVAQLLAERPSLKQRLKEVILAAPDIDAELFKTKIAPTLAASATLYASSNDCALKIAKGFHGYSRAGDSSPIPIRVPGIETVDVSAIDTSFFWSKLPDPAECGLTNAASHAYFAENLCSQTCFISLKD